MTNPLLRHEFELSDWVLKFSKLEALLKSIHETELRSKNVVRNQRCLKELEELRKNVELANQTVNFTEEGYNGFLSRYESLVNQDGFSIKL